MATPIFEFKNVEKTYSDGTKAVRGATFTINKGEFVAIMGASGSGKSTILNIMGFLDSYTKGSYKFEEKEGKNYKPNELAFIRNKKMGFIFQMFNLLARASVLANVTLPLQYSTIPEREWRTLAQEAVDAVGLTHRAGFEPAQLSGGERQRVAIARALVNKPEVIFADEPTGNLDSVTGRSVMAQLQGLHEAGRTIILVTHETDTARHADRIITIHDGVVASDKKVTNKLNAQSFKK